MYKIQVLYFGKKYYWVDTVSLEDEYKNCVAILVNPNDGSVLARDISTISVVDSELL